MTCRTLEDFYHIDAHTFEKQYKEVLSGYRSWSELSHADEWLVFPDNVGPSLAIDETSLSNGELYTIVTNRDRHGREGCLVAVVSGTKSEDVIRALEAIPEQRRDTVREVTLDLSDSMRRIVRSCFTKAQRVIDRFHIQKLACDAVQEMRCQAPLSMGFSRQEYWSGLPSPPAGDLPDPRIELVSSAPAAMQVDSLPTEPPREPIYSHVYT